MILKSIILLCRSSYSLFTIRNATWWQRSKRRIQQTPNEHLSIRGHTPIRWENTHHVEYNGGQLERDKTGQLWLDTNSWILVNVNSQTRNGWVSNSGTLWYMSLPQETLAIYTHEHFCMHVFILLPGKSQTPFSCWLDPSIRVTWPESTNHAPLHINNNTADRYNHVDTGCREMTGREGCSSP